MYGTERKVKKKPIHCFVTFVITFRVDFINKSNEIYCPGGSGPKSGFALVHTDFVIAIYIIWLVPTSY